MNQWEERRLPDYYGLNLSMPVEMAAGQDSRVPFGTQSSGSRERCARVTTGTCIGRVGIGRVGMGRERMKCLIHLIQ